MTDNILKLREIQLEMLEAFDGVCKEHGLTYYACFGTLLGIMRGGGFLPWDDDVDVVMPEKDYSELCGHKDWFDERFFLQAPVDAGLPHFVKLRRNGTTAFRESFTETLKRGGHCGIPVDIIPLAEIPGTGCYRTPTLQSREKQNAVYLKSWFGNPGTGQFENLKLRIPAMPRKVLNEAYGDWMWPQGAQFCTPRYWFFDTENGYEMYFRRYTGMLDGIEGKKIYLFGAADSLRIWLERFGLREQVVCTFDNDPNKWGKKVFGVEVRKPADLPELLDEDSRIIIVSLWHQEIGKQLEQMGIDDYFVYLDDYYDEKVGNKVVRREDLKDGEVRIPKWDG